MTILMAFIAKYGLMLFSLITAFSGTYILGKRKAQLNAAQEQAEIDVQRANDNAIAQGIAKDTEIKTIQEAKNETAKVNILPEPELDSELSKWVTRK